MMSDNFWKNIASDCYATFLGLEIESPIPNRTGEDTKEVKETEKKLMEILGVEDEDNLTDRQEEIMEIVNAYYSEIERQSFMFGFRYAVALMEKDQELLHTEGQ